MRVFFGIWRVRVGDGREPLMKTVILKWIKPIKCTYFNILYTGKKQTEERNRITKVQSIYHIVHSREARKNNGLL